MRNLLALLLATGTVTLAAQAPLPLHGRGQTPPPAAPIRLTMVGAIT